MSDNEKLKDFRRESHRLIASTFLNLVAAVFAAGVFSLVVAVFQPDAKQKLASIVVFWGCLVFAGFLGWRGFRQLAKAYDEEPGSRSVLDVTEILVSNLVVAGVILPAILMIFMVAHDYILRGQTQTP